MFSSIRQRLVLMLGQNECHGRARSQQNGPALAPALLVRREKVENARREMSSRQPIRSRLAATFLGERATDPGQSQNRTCSAWHASFLSCTDGRDHHVERRLQAQRWSVYAVSLSVRGTEQVNGHEVISTSGQPPYSRGSCATLFQISFPRRLSRSNGSCTPLHAAQARTILVRQEPRVVHLHGLDRSSPSSTPLNTRILTTSALADSEHPLTMPTSPLLPG